LQPFKVRPAGGERLDCLGGGLVVLQLGGQQTLLQAGLEVARDQSLPVQPGARGGGRVQPVGAAEGIGGGLEVLRRDGQARLAGLLLCVRPGVDR